MAKSKASAVQDELVNETPQVFCLGTVTPIHLVKPNPENPNVHPNDQLEILAGILRVNGWRQPIVVSKLSGLVVKGHGRLQTAHFMRLKEVPVDFQDYADPQAEYQDMIADNRAAQLSYVDAFKLGNILKKVSADGQKHLGYSQEEIDLFAAAEYVAPEQTERKFVVLETLKMTREAKAIISGAVQKFCLRLGKELDWGDVLAEICMMWQVKLLPDMPQTAPPPRAKAAEKKEPKAKKKSATRFPSEAEAEAEAPKKGSAEFEVKYVAGTMIDGEDAYVVRAEDDGARYHTRDENVAKAAKTAKESKKRLRVQFETSGKEAWITSHEEVA